MTAEIIDYTAERLHRLTLDQMNRGEWEQAQVLSALTEGYLEGLWTVRWQGGEPMFTNIDPSKKSNDFNTLDDIQLSFDYNYEDEASLKGPLIEE